MISPEHAGHIRYVFPRVVFALRLRFQRPPTSPTTPRGDGDTPASQDCSVQQWMNGVKIISGATSATVTLTDDAAPAAGGSDARKGQIMVMCRGPVDQRRLLFFLQVSGLCYSKHLRSCDQLGCWESGHGRHFVLM